MLEGLASRAMLVDMEGRDGTLYVLPPPMAGFFEFSMMRVRDDVDQKLLSELFYEYLTVEDDFILRPVHERPDAARRVFVNEPALLEATRRAPARHGRRARRVRAHRPRADRGLHVLDYERASEVIDTAEHMGVGTCYCRHKKQHLGRACDAPMEICMTFGGTADSLIRHGYARRVDTVEGGDLLQEAYDHNLVQFGENVQRARQLHLQLLRLLLRGDDRGAPLRRCSIPCTRPTSSRTSRTSSATGAGSASTPARWRR